MNCDDAHTYQYMHCNFVFFLFNLASLYGSNYERQNQSAMKFSFAKPFSCCIAFQKSDELLYAPEMFFLLLKIGVNMRMETFLIFAHCVWIASSCLSQEDKGNALQYFTPHLHETTKIGWRDTHPLPHLHSHFHINLQ